MILWYREHYPGLFDGLGVEELKYSGYEHGDMTVCNVRMPFVSSRLVSSLVRQLDRASTYEAELGRSSAYRLSTGYIQKDPLVSELRAYSSILRRLCVRFSCPPGQDFCMKLNAGLQKNGKYD